MHYIFNAGSCSEAKLQPFGPKGVEDRVERLEAARMIRKTRGEWSARPFAKVFAARRIVAVEAKVAEWDAAVQQALLNTWFASESFVLVPHVPRGEGLLHSAGAYGIGVWTVDKADQNPLPPQPGPLPRSYASWLFNEWAWRASLESSAVG